MSHTRNNERTIRSSNSSRQHSPIEKSSRELCIRSGRVNRLDMPRNKQRHRHHSSSRRSRSPINNHSHRDSRSSSSSSSSPSLSSSSSSSRNRINEPQSSTRTSSRISSTGEGGPKSRCLGVFGLTQRTSKRDVEKIFSKFGSIDRVCLIMDAKSGRSRGYCFVYFKHIEDAVAAKKRCEDLTIDRRNVRVDYSTTERPHSPTLGFFRGIPLKTESSRDRSNRSPENSRRYENRDSQSRHSPSDRRHRHRRRH